MFAQPERTLAPHYAAHADFVSLQLFNGCTSVFVCFLTIRLLHLYGWSGGWNNPWHLFRVGGVCKEPEVEAFLFFFFFLLLSLFFFFPFLIRDHAALYFILCHRCWGCGWMCKGRSDGGGRALTGTEVTEGASVAVYPSQNEHRIAGINLITAVFV